MVDKAEKDFKTEVALGNIPGYAIMSALGERESIAVTAAGEDIWRGNELAAAPTSHLLIPTPAAAGEQMTVDCESTNDASAGTGAQQVHIEYIDAAGNEKTETVTLNGTTAVNMVATDIRFVNDMHTSRVGTGGVAAGHIFIHKTGTAGLVYNMIAAGGNKSMVPHRMVPAGKKLVLMGWHCEEGKAKRNAVKIRATSDDEGNYYEDVFQFKDTALVNNSSSGPLELGDCLPSLTIVKISSWADATTGQVSCGWWGYLVSGSNV